MLSVNTTDAIEFVDHVAFRLNEPVMIWGGFGVGKSQGIAQLCILRNAVNVDIRLSQYDSVDLRGFPGIDKDGTTVWHVPSTLPFVGNPRFESIPADTIICLFLDEINAATPAVAAVAYQLVQDRGVGEHKLLPNVRVVAAGNREGDRGVTNRMPMPLANRFTHIEVVPDADAVADYLGRTGKAPPEGVAFLKFRKPLISTYEPSKPELKAVASPRTWEKAFKYDMDEELSPLLKQAAMTGAVGAGPAGEYLGFKEVMHKVIPIREILKDPSKCRIPDRDDASMNYATTVSVAGAMTKDNVAALNTYINRFDAEFVILCWQLALTRDATLYGVPEFITFSQKYRTVFSPTA